MLVFFFGFLIVFFYLLDLIKYPNFVFSTFHVHTKEIGTSFILCVYLYLISSGKAVGIRVGKPDSSLKARLIIIPLLVWVLLRNLFNLQEMLLPDLSFMIKNPLASYDKKMKEKLGKLFYDYVGFIKENTPENAKILIPPFPAYPWPQTGNGIYMRYFLYPRLLISGGEYESLQNLSNFDYVLIAWGETPTTSESFTHGWPKFDVPSEKIIYFSGEPAKRDSNFYRYYQHKNLESWGLIKVRK